MGAVDAQMMEPFCVASHGDCAVDLVGAFDEAVQGRRSLLSLGGRPVLALHDLILAENSGW